MESQIITQNQFRNLDAFDDDGQLIELRQAPERILKRRGKTLPDEPIEFKNRDRTALMADLLMAITYHQQGNIHYTKTEYQTYVPYGNHALISQLHSTCKLVAGKCRQMLAELRDNGLIETKEVKREKTHRFARKDKINGNTAILIYITPKGTEYLDKLKDIHRNYYPILKDCYMIKSGLVNL